MAFTIKKIFSNSFWLIFDKFFRIGLKLIVSILLTNYLGSEKFGQLNYALSVVMIFFSFSALGLDGIIVNEFVIDPGKRSEIITNSLMLKLFAGIVCIALLFFSDLFFHFDSTTIILFKIFCVGQLFGSFEIIDYWFQSILKAQITVLARVISLVLISILQVLAIYKNLSLYFIASVISSEFVFIAIFYVYFYLKKSSFQFQFNFKLAFNLLGKSWPLIISSFGSILYLKIDQVMIEYYYNTKLVGVYSVAVQYSTIWYFLPAAIAASFFPLLISENKTERFDNIIIGCYSLMFLIGFSVAIVINLIGPLFIRMVYHREFWDAGNILVIHIWGGVFIFMRGIFSKWLIIKEKLIYSIHTHVTGAAVNILLNLYLIPKYSLTGAAVSTLISYSFASYFSAWFFPQLRPAAKHMTLAMVKPFYYIKFILYYDKKNN